MDATWEFRELDQKLVHSDRMLKEVTITSGLISMKGDTIEINANKIKVLPNSDVSQLLQKIPGVEVLKDGSIKVYGSEVSKILVDGSDFFGSNPGLVSKNLDADMVDKVQIFDDKDENGQAAHNNSKTINLKLKKGKKLGVFGDVLGGYGTGDHYEGGLRINSFKDDRKFSFVSNSNNINGRGFDFGFNNWHGNIYQERNGYSGTYDAFTNPFDVENTSGNLNRTSDAAASFFNEYPGKRKLSFNVSATNTYFTTRDAVTGITSLGDSATQTRKSINHSQGTANNIDASIAYSRERDSTLRINMSISGGLTKNAEDFKETDSLYFNQHIINHGINDYNRTTLKSSSTFNLHIYERSHKKQYLYYVAGIRADYNGSQTSTYQYSEGIDAHYNYKLSSQAYNYRLLLNMRGVVPIYKHLRLGIDADAYKSLNDYNAHAYSANDSARQDYSQQYDRTLNTFSVHFYNSVSQISTKGFLALGDKKYYMSAGITWLNLQLYNRDYASGVDLLTPYHLWLPYLNYSNWGLKNTYISADISKVVDFPNNVQLLPVSNLSDPWVHLSGNPLLLPFEQWNFSAYYNISSFKRLKSFWSDFNLNQSDNYFAQSNTVDNAGITYRKPVNLSGYFTENVNLSPTFKISKIFNISCEVLQKFNRIPAIVNNQAYIATTRSYGITPGIGIEISDKTEINISANYDYTQYINPNNPSFGFNQLIPVYTAGIRSDLWQGAEIKTDFNVTDNRAIPGVGRVINLWNLYYQQALDKKGKYNLKVTCYDLLNNNIGLSRTATGSYISIQQNNILQRFFMLTLVYKMKGKKTESGGSVY